MTVIHRGKLNILIIGSSLLLMATINCEVTQRESRFIKAVEYWTETLCLLQKTKTFAFHGVFANSTKTLRDFFDVLLHKTVEYCSAVVLLNAYTLSNFRRDPGSNMTNSNTGPDFASKRQHTEMEKTNAVTPRQGIRRSLAVLDILHHKWNVKRGWLRNDEYLIDVCTVNVIFLEDSDTFEKLLDSNTSFKWTNVEHFIVLAVWNDRLAKLRDRRPLIDRTLRKLWLEHQIQNVFLVEPLSGREDFHFYSYNPFGANNGGWGRLESVDGSSKRRMLRSLSTLTYRRAVNFNGYKFNVSIFDQDWERIRVRGGTDLDPIYVYSGGYRGPSGILLGVLAKKLNFNVNVIEPSTDEKYGHRMGNGTFSGAVGDVAYRRVVASFASFFVKNYVDDMNGIEFTTTIGFDQVCVIVPKATKVPKGLRIFYIVDLHVWLGMTVSFIMVYVTWHYIEGYSPLCSEKNSKILGELSEKVGRYSTHLRLLYLCTGYPISLQATSERCLLIGIFFSAITLVGVFNGALYETFATNIFYKDIDSLVELNASGLPIGFFSYSTGDVFGVEDEADLSPLWKSLQRKMIFMPAAIKAVAFDRNVSTLLRDEYFTLIRESLIDKSGTYMLHRVNECPARFHLACLLPKNSFMRERINIMIGRMNQAGLPTLWKTRTIIQNALKMKVNIHKDCKFKKPAFMPFQLNDLQISFSILGVGLLSSTVMFCTEKGWIRLCCKKKKNHAQ